MLSMQVSPEGHSTAVHPASPADALLEAGEDGGPGPLHGGQEADLGLGLRPLEVGHVVCAGEEDGHVHQEGGRGLRVGGGGGPQEHAVWSRAWTRIMMVSVIDSIPAPSRRPEPSISSHPALIFNLTQCDDTAILKVEVVPIQNFPTTSFKRF